LPSHVYTDRVSGSRRHRERIALGVPKAQVARDLGVSRTTLYNALEGKGIYAEGEGQR
jgi:DNA-binding XRE family transcriptional regulator